MPQKLKRSPGTWVEGDRFWNREKEVKLFIEYLQQGTHLRLVAQRRIGKTSLMREAARRLGDKLWCLHIDLQKSHSPQDAIVEISIAAHAHAPAWERVKTVFANVLDRVESVAVDELSVTLRSGLTAGDWQAKGDRLLATLAGLDKPVVLFIDEVPILVSRLLKGADYKTTPERRQQTDAFLSWLRYNAIRHQNRLTFVLTGSVGLEPIVRQAGLSGTLNAFTAFELRPWEPDVATACLQALASETGLRLETAAIEHMLDRLGACIPGHVQMFFDHLYRACRQRDIAEVSPELVAEVYEDSMLGTRGHVELSHMEERLRMVLEPERYLLGLDLLTEAAVGNRLTPEAARSILSGHDAEEERPAEVLGTVLGILEHDGYLRKDGDKYVFVSTLLKDWWKRHLGFSYVPIAKREGR